MTEILFRGKHEDNGEWVYGNLLGDSTIVPTGQTFEIEGNKIYGCDLEAYPVDPETVGRYTGLTDKNGKKIFEGDIVRTQIFYDKPYSSKQKGKQFIGIVKYKVRQFKGNRFHPKQNYYAYWGLDIKEDFGKYIHYSWGDLWACEIIGNLHDNPELLEVQA